MFKRLSDRAEKAIQRAFRSPAPKPPKIKLRYTDWKGLKSLVVLLNQNAGPFEQLASVIGNLSAYVEKYDIQARAVPGYAQLGADLDDLCLHMAKYIDSELQLFISAESIANFARGLTHEVKSLHDERGGGIEGEQATTVMNINLVLKGYRRIRKLLALFVMSENTDLWKTEVDNSEAPGTKKLPHSPEAHYRYTGPEAVPRNGCMLNTRVAVLQELRDWVYYGRSRNVLWLNGTAGTGKTAVAYSFCEYLEDSGRLSASFFCSRIHPSCRDVKRIVPSIVYQLAQQSRPFRCSLSRAISQDPGVFERPVDEQFKILIYVPLQKVAHTFNADPVIVIDALDQCDDREAVNLALDAILKHASSLPVRFLIVSYTTLGIRSRMRGLEGAPAQPDLCLHQQDKGVIREDVKMYLTTRLQHMALPTPDLERLLLCTGELFVYAAVIVDYIHSGDASKRMKRLKDLIKHSDPSRGSQNKDTVYAAILERGLRGECSDPTKNDELKLVPGALASTEEQVSINTIAGLLRLDFARLIRSSFRWLIPMLRVSPKDNRTLFLDEQFTGFLRSRLHPDGDFREDSKSHLRLARACFDTIRSVDPPFNICSLESSYLKDQEVAYFVERVDEIILPELLYACRSWGTHTSLAGPQDHNLTSNLEDFFSTRLLLWMEVLNLRECMEQGVKLLSEARSWVQVGIDVQIARRYTDCFQDERYPTTLRASTEEAYEFVHTFSSSVASNSTPHIYVSQLQLWPQDREIYRYYGYRLNRFTNRSHDGHTGSIMSVAYSSDGAYIASGSSDKTIRTWDTRTGKPVGQPLTGHTSWVRSVAYSPDGAYIVSGSEDNTIRIWDAHTGKAVGQPLTGHAGSVYSAVYSPDGAYIASGCNDNTIRIWDTRTDKPVGRRLTGHTFGVYSVAYSPDGAYIASGSSDDTIRIWDTRTRKPVGRLLTGHTNDVNSIACSPHGTYIASGSDDNTIRIWDTRNGKPVGQPLTGHAGEVNSVAYSPDGTYIASGSDDRTIRIWDAHTCESVGQPLTGHTHWVWSVAYSPDGAYIVSGSEDKTIRIWFAPTRPKPEPAQQLMPSRRPAIEPFRRPFWIAPEFANRTSRDSRPNHTRKANRILKQQVATVPPITASPHDWTLNEDGWVVGPSQERLIWVPQDLRNAVAPPRTKTIMSEEPSIVFDFREAKLGLNWQDSYNPS
ncbi:hypothetical protein FRC12_003631 [Ceratobasidium sp. 428]|nr:hypothetical protein FRC12_003631 [Ceratobasidium sp. 428]